MHFKREFVLPVTSVYHSRCLHTFQEFKAFQHGPPAKHVLEILLVALTYSGIVGKRVLASSAEKSVLKY